MQDSKKDLLTVHYLRGVCATGIMVFHFTSTALGRYSAQDFFGKFGVYAVAIFYILSGIALFHVYFERWENSAQNIFQFYLKRATRIFPLFWVSSILIYWLQNFHRGAYNNILYFSGLFAILKWDYSVSPVAWSIGNELFFYSTFPLLIWLTRKNVKWLSAYAILFAGIYLYFAFYMASTARPLPEQWNVYTNPLNQYFLFISGFVLGYTAKYLRFTSGFAKPCFWLLVILFVVTPLHGDPAHLIYGVPRVYYTILCIGICGLAMKIEFRIPGLVGKMLYKLGDLSYSIYMLHPLVWMFFDDFYNPRVTASKFFLSPVTRIYISIPATLVLSSLSYYYFELKLINLVKRRVAKNKQF